MKDRLKYNPLFLFVFVLQFLMIPLASSQDLSTQSKRAEKQFLEGQAGFNLLDYQKAEEHLNKAIAIDENFLEAYMLLGDVCREQQKLPEAVEIYRRMIKVDSVKYPEVYYFAGLAYYQMAAYNEGSVFLTKFFEN